MSEVLINRMRNARKFIVEVDGFKFICHRPTQADATEMYAEGYDNHRIAATFVSGWEGVKESDLAPGGANDEAEFTPTLWRAWVADEARFWKPIADRIIEEYSRRNKQEIEAGND